MKGRKGLLSQETIEDIYNNRKADLYLDSSNQLAKCSAEVWNEIVRDFHLKVNPKTLYLAIKRYAIKIQPHEKFSEKSLSSVSDSSSTDADIDSSSEDPNNCLFFKLFISKDVWSSHKPEWRSRRCRKAVSGETELLKFTGSWVYTFMSVIYETCKLPCTWHFKDYYIASSQNAKYYFTMKGKCECSAIITISKKNDANIDPLNNGILLDCTVYHYDNLYNHKKKYSIKGALRHEIGNEMIMKGQTASYRRKHMAAEHSNMFMKEPGIIPNLQTLRKIKSSTKNIGRIHIDPILEIANFAQRSPYSNIIHEIGHTKFFVHYWSPEQVRLYNYFCKQEVGSVCVDATGGVCDKLKRLYNTSGHIMLYSIVIHLKNETEGQVPVCQMISERNNANAIQYWMSEWIRLGAVVPKVFICDHSLAIISAACRAFSGDPDSNSYANRCLQLLLKKDNIEIPQCFIRIDVAHLIKSVLSWNSLKSCKLRIRQFYVRAIGQLIISTDIKEFESILYDIFVVATNEYEGHIDDTPTVCEGAKQRLLHKFSYGVQQSCIKEILENDFLLEKENKDSNSEVNKDCPDNDIKKWINRIYTRSSSIEEVGNRDNIMYSPEIAKSLMRLCYRFPLWTAVMVQIYGYGNLTATSTHVESYFSDLKNRLFRKLPLRADEFLNEHLHILEGTMKLASGLNYFYTSTQQIVETEDKKSVLQGITNNILNVDDDVVELRTVENWKGKAEAPENMQKKRKISKYMNPCSEWKTMEMDITKMGRPVKIGIIKNGGTLSTKTTKTSKGKTYTVTNTCAFDSIIQVLSAIYCDSKNTHGYMTENENSLFELAIILAKQNVVKDVYDRRLNLLLGVFSSTRIAQSDLYRIDCVSNIIALINKLNIVSFINASECRNCRNIQNIATKFITPIKLDNLRNLVLRNDENVRCRNCNSSDVETDTLYSDIIFIDTSEVKENEFIEIAKEVLLCDLANTIVLDKQTFYLRGAIHFRAPNNVMGEGHYISYVKRLNFSWEAYDDLVDKVKVVPNNTLINCAVLVYSK